MDTMLIGLVGSVVLLAAVVGILKTPHDASVNHVVSMAAVALVAVIMFTVVIAIYQPVDSEMLLIEGESGGSEMLLAQGEPAPEPTPEPTPEPQSWVIAGSSTQRGDVTFGVAPAVTDLFDGGGTVEFWTVKNGYASSVMIEKGWNISCNLAINDKCLVRFAHPFSGGYRAWVSEDWVFTHGQPHHVAITYDNSSVDNNPTIYLDGVPLTLYVGSHATGTPLSDDGISLGMLNPHGYSHMYHDGWIDEVRMWDTVRTIDELYDNPLTGSESGLVGYWPMNEGQGTTVYDATANGNDGTMTDLFWAEMEYVQE
jgi:hypothetical protein